MVGELRDKIGAFGPRQWRSVTHDSPSTGQTIEIDLTEDQFEALRSRWTPSISNVPAEFVLRLGSQVIGSVQVISWLMVDPKIVDAEGLT